MRPATAIAAFSAAFLGAAALDLIGGLIDLSYLQRYYEAAWPQLTWTRDWTIVALSATFTIACIPVALIVFARVRIARWLALIAAGYAVIAFAQWAIPAMMRGEPVAPAFVVRALLMAVAFAFLASPPASRWFARPPRRMADA